MMIGFIKQLNKERNKLTRRIRNILYLLIFSAMNKSHRSRCRLTELNQAKSVGILMTQKGIGDFIVTSGIIKPLEEAGCTVTFIADHKVARIPRLLIKDAAVMEIPLRGSLRQLRKLNLALDVIIDPSDPDKNLFRRIGYMLGIQHHYLIGVNQGFLASKYIFDITLSRKEINTHYSDRLKALIAPLLKSDFDYKYNLSFSSSTVKTVSGYFASLDKSQYIIVYNPRASQKERSLNEQNTKLILERLSTCRNLLIITLNTDLTPLQASCRRISACPFTNLDECIYLLKFADLLISTDTCFVHGATFFGTRTICLYNNKIGGIVNYDSNNFWGPHSDNAVQLCSPHHPLTEGGDDINNIDMDLVLDTISGEIQNLYKKPPKLQESAV